MLLHLSRVIFRKLLNNFYDVSLEKETKVQAVTSMMGKAMAVVFQVRTRDKVQNLTNCYNFTI